MITKKQTTLFTLSLLIAAGIVPVKIRAEHSTQEKSPEYWEELKRKQLAEIPKGEEARKEAVKLIDQLGEECFIQMVDYAYSDAAQIIELIYGISKHTLAKHLLMKEMKKWAQILEGDADPRSPEEQEQWLNEVFEPMFKPMIDEMIARYKAKKAAEENEQD